VGDLVTAETEREGAVTRKTLEDRDRALRRWKVYAKSIGIIDDIWFDHLDRADRIKVFGAFAVALQQGPFS
jgi:hypothetical protein